MVYAVAVGRPPAAGGARLQRAVDARRAGCKWQCGREPGGGATEHRPGLALRSPAYSVRGGGGVFNINVQPLSHLIDAPFEVGAWVLRGIPDSGL